MQSLCCQNTSLSVVHGYWPTSIVTTMFENNQPSIAVLLPCFNEEVTIGKVVRDFKAALPDATVYVYDNNSTDRTAEIAAAEGAIVRREPRQGKGNVIRAMFEDIDADVYVMADGDDTYPADAAPAMVSKVLDGYDMVMETASHPLISKRTSVRSTTSATGWSAVPSTACSMRTSPIS